MIDTTYGRGRDRARASPICQGKSVHQFHQSRRTGEEKFERVCPLAPFLTGAAIIVGLHRRRSQSSPGISPPPSENSKSPSVPATCLTGKYGIRPEKYNFSIHSSFPLRHGRWKTTSVAPFETIEGIRLIKKSIPHVRTVLGISKRFLRTSHPAPREGRQTSVFLYYCTKARPRSSPIVNAERIERFPPRFPSTSAPLTEKPDSSIAVPTEIPDTHSASRKQFAALPRRLARTNRARPESRHQSVSHSRPSLNIFPRLRFRGQESAAPKIYRSISGLGELHSRRLGRTASSPDLNRKLAGRRSSTSTSSNGPLMAGMAEVGSAVQ